jgi:hypothetical protein
MTKKKWSRFRLLLVLAVAPTAAPSLRSPFIVQESLEDAHEQLTSETMTTRDLHVNSSSTELFVDLNDRVNPAWADLKATLKNGVDSYGPALGSTIAVNHPLIQNGSSYSQRTIPRNTLIHTPTNSYISPAYYHMQTRWYQEDNNTQIYRMFPGDDNVRNTRNLAPRVESFSTVGWKRGDGWFEFSARYTFIKLRAATVFQIKHNADYWSMQLVVNQNQTSKTWDLYYVKLRDSGARRLVQSDIQNKSFDIRIMDDGTYHKVFVNNTLKVEGNMTLRKSTEVNKARWGFYSPGSAMTVDILMFVTGAYVGRVTS